MNHPLNVTYGNRITPADRQRIKDQQWGWLQGWEGPGYGIVVDNNEYYHNLRNPPYMTTNKSEKLLRWLWENTQGKWMWLNKQATIDLNKISARAHWNGIMDYLQTTGIITQRQRNFLFYHIHSNQN